MDSQVLHTLKYILITFKSVKLLFIIFKDTTSSRLLTYIINRFIWEYFKHFLFNGMFLYIKYKKNSNTHSLLNGLWLWSIFKSVDTCVPHIVKWIDSYSLTMFDICDILFQDAMTLLHGQMIPSLSLMSLQVRRLYLLEISSKDFLFCCFVYLTRVFLSDRRYFWVNSSNIFTHVNDNRFWFNEAVVVSPYLYYLY